MARATPREVRLAAAQLAVCGLGGRMCWYALNVAIDVFSDAFGYSIYPEMLFVYNVSATVGLVLQVLFDAQCDAQYGIRRTFACRYMAGVLWLVGLQLIFPLVARLDPGSSGGARGVAAQPIEPSAPLCFHKPSAHALRLPARHAQNCRP